MISLCQALIGLDPNDALFVLDAKKYTTSRLLTPRSGSLAYRDELVQEICNITGKSMDTNIPTWLRNNPRIFFEMFEKKHRGAAEASAATAAAAPASSQTQVMAATASAAPATQ